MKSPSCYIILRSSPKRKSAFKKACEGKGRTMTEVLEMAIDGAIKKVKRK